MQRSGRMESTVPQSQSTTPAIEVSSLLHSAELSEARLQSSIMDLTNTRSTSDISQATDEELDLTVNSEDQTSTVLTPSNWTKLVTAEAVDLRTESSTASLQTPKGMETQTSHKGEAISAEKSSYEIAAEALCLMKSGGVKSLNEKQKTVVMGSADAQINASGSRISQAQNMYLSTEDKLIQNVTVGSFVTETNVIFTNTGNTPAAVSFAKSQVQVDKSCQPNIESGSVGNDGSRLSTLTLPFESFSESQPVGRVHSLTDATSGQPVKYVLVPESALLSTVKPGEIVSVPGTQYLFVMPKEKNQLTKALAIPELEVLTQGQRQLQTKGSVSTDTVSNSKDIASVVANIISSQNALEEPQFKENLSQPSTAERKTCNAKRSTKKHDSLKFPPCIICDGEASGFHYGCNTCEACKNFFRRCLLRKSNTPFICHSGKNCEISHKKNKNNCSACRLDKCLEMGMAKEKCKMGRYTALMRTETIKKVRRLEGKDDDSLYNSSEDSPGPSICQENESCQQMEAASATVRELYDVMISKQIYSNSNNLPEQESTNEYNEELVEYLVGEMEKIKPWGENLLTEESRKTVIEEHYEKYRAKVESFGQLNAVSMQEYQVLLRKFGIDIDGQWETFKQCTFDWEECIERYCRFAKCIPEFRSLSFGDQACLLKATHFDFFVIVLHQGYFPEYGVFLEINGVPLHIEEAANKFFSRELVLAMTDMMSRIQKLNLSKSEMALLITIVTMSSDQCKLENPTLVENTQLRLVDLLLKETNRIYGQVTGRRRFTSVIDILTKMRDVSNIYYKEYRALCKDDLIKKAMPNLDCVLPDEI